MVMFRPAFAPVGAAGWKRVHRWPFSLAENGGNSAQNFTEIQQISSGWKSRPFGQQNGGSIVKIPPPVHGIMLFHAGKQKTRTRCQRQTGSDFFDLEGEVKIDIFSKGLRQKDLGVLRPVRGRIVFLRATLETNRSGDQQSRLRQSSSRLPVLTCRRYHRLASVFPR